MLHNYLCTIQGVFVSKLDIQYDSMLYFLTCLQHYILSQRYSTIGGRQRQMLLGDIHNHPILGRLDAVSVCSLAVAPSCEETRRSLLVPNPANRAGAAGCY